MRIPQLLAFFDTISAPPPPMFEDDHEFLAAGYEAVHALVRDMAWSDDEFRDKQQLAAQLHWVSVPW